MDPERALRESVVEQLSLWGDAQGEASVSRLNGRAGSVDVLFRPHDERLNDLTLAVELKLPDKEEKLPWAYWIKQAADYVGASPNNGWPPIAASFLWLMGLPEPSDPEKIWTQRGMFRVAAQFRVGVVCPD